MIDPSNQYDQIVLNRISNLEERLKDIAAIQTKFVSISQIHEIYSVLNVEIEKLKSVVISLEKRLSILEDISSDD
jgi:hypothetical protein